MSFSPLIQNCPDQIYLQGLPGVVSIIIIRKHEIKYIFKSMKKLVQNRLIENRQFSDLYFGFVFKPDVVTIRWAVMFN